MAARRRRLAGRLPGDPPDVELPQHDRDPGTAEAGLHGSRHEPPLGQQRGGRRFREHRARHQAGDRIPEGAARHQIGDPDRPFGRRPQQQLLSGGRGDRHFLLQRREQALEMQRRTGRPAEGGRNALSRRPSRQHHQHPARIERLGHRRGRPVENRPGARSVRSEERLQPGRRLRTIRPNSSTAIRRRSRRA